MLLTRIDGLPVLFVDRTSSHLFMCFQVPSSGERDLGMDSVDPLDFISFVLGLWAFYVKQ